MDAATHNSLNLCAQALSYPAPGRLHQLQAGMTHMAEGPARRSFSAFLAGIQALTLCQWEELCTRTLDLNPPAAPYVGYQVWGEGYQRGAFLAKMSRALRDTGIETGGELPDHLAPVLTYLALTPQPLPELAEAFAPALDRIVKTLCATDPANPYVKLFEAIRAAYHLPPREDA
jgi:nitrate reductase molybdenum cofactor assembly chaperone NarJ/NarW